MKAYIFDIDGTILDSMGVWRKIDIDFLQKRGITAPPDYAETIAAMTSSEAAAYTIERFALPDSAAGLMQEWNDMATYAYEHTVSQKPHAKEYITSLKERGALLAVATCLPAELQAPALRGHGFFDLFNVICGADEAKYGKSRPDIYLLAAKKLGVAPRDCMVFEDILTAVKSAKEAGMTVCGVYDKASENDWEAIKKIADYAIVDFRDAPRE